jgi:AraC family transcriptional regulator
MTTLAVPAVPVTMGAHDAHTREFGPFRLTDAWFEPHDTLDRHIHDRVTFAVMLEGSFDLVIGGRRLSCTPGTVFTEPVGDPHTNHMGRAGARVMALQPDPADFPSSCVRFLDRVNHLESRALHRLAGRLAHELRTPDDLTPLEAQAVAFEMLAAGARLGRASAQDKGPPAWLTRIVERMHDGFRGGLSLEELAREAGVHPAHVARMFRRWYRTSPGAYLRTLRIQWAAGQLSGDESLSAVALRAGFADQAHFTRAFRRHWGVPPGRYRAERKGS